jgi:hypothetical protein
VFGTSTFMDEIAKMHVHEDKVTHLIDVHEWMWRGV